MGTRSPLLRLGSLLVAASLLLGGTARAQEGASKEAALEDARAHVGKAKVHYDLGEYEEAAEEYILVYRIKALPALLFNIAQAYRQAGKYEKARQFYKSFLRESPDQKSKPVIQKAIKEIDELLAKDKRARELGPNGTAEATQLAAPAQETVKPPAATPRPTASAAPASSSSASASAAPSSPAVAQPAPVRRATSNAVAAASGASVQPASAKGPAGQTRPAVAVVAQRPAAPSEITRQASVPASSTAEESTPVYKKWWLWTAVGVVAVGAGAAALTMGGNTAPGSHFGTSKVFP
jgi:hypothetical protein